MTEAEKAKLYLKQIKRLRNEIDILIHQRNELEELAMCTGAINIQPDKVQSSPNPNRTTDKIDSIVDMEEFISQKIETYKRETTSIIQMIARLETEEKFRQLLRLRYVKFERFEEIALDMGYSYESVRHMHKDALEEFAKQYDSEISFYFLAKTER